MRLKKLLPFFIVQLSFNVAYAKDFSVEDVKNAEKYVLYESVYHGVSPATIIGLHCLTVNEPSKFIKDYYKELNHPVFKDKKVNKKICDMAKDGLLKFDSIDEFEAEIKKLESKHNH
jgi:hypothetical protein